MPVGTRSKTRNKKQASTFTSASPLAQGRSPARHSPAQHSQDELQSPNSCSPRTGFTPATRTNAAGLPLHVQKSLLQDIEESGGLGLASFGLTSSCSAKAFALKNICNRRSDIYGVVGSERRRQVQNKVSRWKCLEQADYYLLLANLGVRPAQGRTLSTERSSSPPHPPHKKPLVSKSTSPADTESTSRFPPQDHRQLLSARGPVPLPPRSSATPTPGEKRATLLPTDRSMATRHLFPLLEDDDYGTTRDNGATLLLACIRLFFSPCVLSCKFTDIIDVNVTRPERNREVKVFHLNSVNIDGALHDGYEIAVYGDMRDVGADKYKAWFRGRNEVLVQVPLMEVVFLHDPVCFINCARTQESHDVARSRILKDERSQTRRLLLRFPENLELTNSVFSPKSLDGEIELEVVPFKSDFSIGAKKFTTTGARVSWKIAVIGAEKRETKAPGNKGETKLLEKLTSMSI
jgi:hypothetical protein